MEYDEYSNDETAQWQSWVRQVIIVETIDFAQVIDFAEST